MSAPFISPAHYARLTGLRLGSVYSKLADGSLAAEKDEAGRWRIPFEAVQARLHVAEQRARLLQERLWGLTNTAVGDEI